MLAILEMFGGKLSAIQLQKYLFLVTRMQSEKSFYFVPYRYGCFSFQANQDMTTLGTYGYVNVEDADYVLNDSTLNFQQQLDIFDQHYVKEVFGQFGKMTQDELLTYIYVQYPFYAINSSIAKRLLSEEQLAKVEAQRRKKDERQLFTIGYEGVSLEQYINKLIVEDVHILCDVRKNAFSQKYGFSKSQLEKACVGVGIQYVHVPDLGIESNKRQKLSCQQDYDTLFEEYEQTVLPHQTKTLEYVRELIMNGRRIALTCFEKDPRQCHRTRVANALMHLSDNEYSLKHIQF